MDGPEVYKRAVAIMTEVTRRPWRAPGWAATAAAEGRLGPGDRVCLAAFGPGLVWGGVVLEWTS